MYPHPQGPIRNLSNQFARFAPIPKGQRGGSKGLPSRAREALNITGPGMVGYASDMTGGGRSGALGRRMETNYTGHDIGRDIAKGVLEKGSPTFNKRIETAQRTKRNSPERRPRG